MMKCLIFSEISLWHLCFYLFLTFYFFVSCFFTLSEFYASYAVNWLSILFIAFVFFCYCNACFSCYCGGCLFVGCYWICSCNTVYCCDTYYALRQRVVLVVQLEPLCYDCCSLDAFTMLLTIVLEPYTLIKLLELLLIEDFSLSCTLFRVL
jgi:hypothetical protein